MEEAERLRSKKRQKISHHGSAPESAQGHRTQLQVRQQALMKTRQALPIWKHRDTIKKNLRNHDVLILSGETGSGKSTQVPQFLVEQQWCKKAIAVTEPRRMAAISLARRVAEEMGTPLGASSPKSKVGYSVRFDQSTSVSTRIKFLTEGMLLQEMLRDPTLDQYSVVIVDEVHERSLNVDLILGFLQMIRSGEKGFERSAPLKLVIMSATADVDAISRFFERENPPHAKVDAKATANLEQDQNKLTNGSANHDDKTTNGKITSQTKSPVQSLSVEGRQYSVKTVYLPRPTQDFVDSALEIILKIHTKEPLPGDILVFMTGQDTVEMLESSLREYSETMDRQLPRLMIMPLFAALPQAAQQAIFTPTPPRTRKVVIATNIAETSVTVPGIVFVVDSGKCKVKQYRSKLGLDSLLVQNISKSSATQRKGRAGREAAGTCYRLYTEKDYLDMEKMGLPEILRCDLASALLIMKARGVQDLYTFPYLDVPAGQALGKALQHLHHIGALADNGDITDAGRQMARLPLAPSMSRVILAAAVTGDACLTAVIDVVACLSVENVLLVPRTEEQHEAVAESRSDIHQREGDHLTLLATLRGYLAQKTERKTWCVKRLINHRALQQVLQIRKQLRALCISIGLVTKEVFRTANDNIEHETIDEALSIAIRRAFLHGFFPDQIARLVKDGTYQTLGGNHTVAIHPSSVLYGRKLEGILFTEFVFTNRSWARTVSAVQLGWITEMLAEAAPAEKV